MNLRNLTKLHIIGVLESLSLLVMRKLHFHCIKYKNILCFPQEKFGILSSNLERKLNREMPFCSWNSFSGLSCKMGISSQK